VNHNGTSSKTMATSVVKWTARLWSLASLGFLAMFMIGEGFNPVATLTSRQWAWFVCFPFGMTLGLLLGWWREITGGAIAVGGLLGFYVLEMVFAGRPPGGPWFALVAAPGFLFLLSGLLSRGAPSSARQQP